MKYEKIPSKYQVGGTDMEVRRVDRCDDNTIGTCILGAGYIEISDMFNRDSKQSEGSKINTFYHELTHSILATMGETDLNNNERFVNSFAGFLTEAMKNAYFREEE